MNLIGFFGAGVILLVGGLLLLRFFPNELAQFLRRMAAPSESAIKKQSAERLAEMDRNLAERKARAGG